MREADTEAVYWSFVSAVDFFYHNGLRLVAVSVLWFVCSLPLLTVGPATLGAYTSIATLRDGPRIDRKRVVRTVKQHGISATLLTGIPFVLGAIAALYAQQYLATRSTPALVLGVVTTNAAAYAALTLIPTFAGLATGADLESSLGTAVRWTARNGVAAVMMGMTTLLLFVVTALLTIAFVLVFAGVTFSFHLETVLESPERNVENTTPEWRTRTNSRN